MAERVLELKHINKYFGKSHVIKDVNLAFEKGEFITFLGPSGCGKTTLLRMIAGFYEPDDGEILLNGKNIERVPPYNRNTAMVFQEYALFPHMNVFENVAYGLRVKHKPAAEIESRVKEALSLMQLTGMEKRFPNQMSGGQQQRVAVARALVMNPELLLLDEPLSNLDAKLRESVRVELRDIQQKMGLSTIYVTHDQSEALSMSDRIVVLKDGVVHQVGTPQEIYFQPKTAFVADFIGTTNLIPLKGEKENTVSYGNVRFTSTNPVEEGRDYCASIRPESTKLSRERAEGRVNVPVEIFNHMFLGEKVRYFVKDGEGREWIVDMFDTGRTILDGSCYLTFPEDRAWVI
jgi:ABC-type Fe3+/spermidine/putrescine transport system ATPase subunit